MSAPECFFPPGTPQTEGFDDSQPLRIVGGRPSVHGENPHIVMLSYKGFGGYGQFCDGSIIHKRFILTAAHCFVGWDESPSTYEVVVGAYNKVEKALHQKTYLLESITCHKNYKVSSRQIIYDVCILKTTEDMEFNKYVWPICLPDNMPPPNDGSYDGYNCTVAGWGDTRFTGDEKILNEVDVPVLTYETCVEWYEAENILIDKDQHVCAGYEHGGLDACQGDSGGPFVCKRGWGFGDKDMVHEDLKVLTGVVSFGVGCALAKNPGVYTNVYHFLEYIHTIVNEHDACAGHNPCQNGGTCIDTYHDYTCDCEANFIGENCQLHKGELNACYNHSCQHGKCLIDPDDPDNYTCECYPDYSGYKCENLDNLCRETDCGGLDADGNERGVCVLNDDGAECVCNDGWTGADCKQDIDECLTGVHACHSLADCDNTQGSYMCICPVGYMGDGLVTLGHSSCFDIDECEEKMHNCGPQSDCVNTEGTFECSCREGFEGNPPAIRCAKTKVERGCPKITDSFDTPFTTFDDETVKYDIECGFNDGGVLGYKEIVNLPGDIKHPISTNVRQNEGANSCKITCKPGTIPQYPRYAKTADGLSANVICEAKGKKSVWKPNGKQVRCYGCQAPAGAVLSNCTTKGKKYTICTAKCVNDDEGARGEWRTRCSKKKGVYLWDSIAAKIEQACKSS